MNQTKTILHRIFNIKESERKTVTLLFFHHFMQGFGLALVFIVANTFFLSEYSVKQLPNVYITSGVLVLITGRIYAWYEHHLDTKKLLRRVIITSFSLLAILGLSSFYFSPGIFAFILLASYQVFYLLNNLEFWGLSALVFDVRQSKRLFGLISAGDMPAKMLGYLIVPLIAPFFPLKFLILLSAFTILGSIYFLNALLKIHHLHDSNSVDINHTYNYSRIGTGPVDLLKRFFRNRFIVIAAILSIIAVITLATINFSFLSEVKYKFKSDKELASFFGLFFAVGQFITIFTKAFFSGRVIQWMGIRKALMALPLSILLIIGAGFIIQGVAQDYRNLIYIYGFLMLITDILNYALHQPLFLSLFQPLNAHLRLHGHTVIKGFVDGIGLIVVGLGIITLIQLGTSNKLMNFGLVIFSLGIVWILWVLVTESGYLEMLKNAIKIRRLSGSAWQFDDENLIKKITEKLETGKPWEKIYHLELLKNNNSGLFKEYILKAIESQDQQVSDWAIKHIPYDFMETKIDLLKPQAISSIDQGQPRYNLIRQVTLYDTSAYEWCKPRIENNDPRLTQVFIEGLLNGKSIEGIVLAGNKLIQLRDSASQKDKLITCNIIENLRLVNFHEVLMSYIKNETDLTIHRKAILTASKLRIKPIQQYIFSLIEKYRMQSWYLNAIANYKEDCIEYFLENPDQGEEVAASLDSLIYISKNVPGDKSKELLLQERFLQYADIRGKALEVLAGYSFNENEVKFQTLANKWIDLEINYLKEIIEFYVPGNKNDLSATIELEIDNTKHRIFNWLHILYPAADMPSKRNAYFSHFTNKRANALENLDRILSNKHKTKLFAMLETTPSIDTGKKDEIELINTILGNGRKFSCAWTTAFCINVATHNNYVLDNVVIIPLKDCSWKIVSEQYNLYLKNNLKEKSNNMGGELMELEKVSILKNTSLFSETPEDLLVDLASYVKTVRLEVGDTLFKEGDPGDAMFIIHSGSIEVSDNNKTLATFGELDFFGELSLLDDEPRSASATAKEDSLLLSISQVDFYELITFRTEVAKSILRVLSQRLRKQNKS